MTDDERSAKVNQAIASVIKRHEQLIWSLAIRDEREQRLVAEAKLAEQADNFARVVRELEAERDRWIVRVKVLEARLEAIVRTAEGR